MRALVEVCALVSPSPRLSRYGNCRHPNLTAATCEWEGLVFT